MLLSERLGIARATYRAAVARARDANTPQSWRRLVRAGANLREVEAEARRPVPTWPVRRPASMLLVEDSGAARDALRDLLSGRFRERNTHDRRAALVLLHPVKTPP